MAVATTLVLQADSTVVSRTQLLMSVEGDDPREDQVRRILIQGSASYTTYTLPEISSQAYFRGVSLASGLASSASGEWIVLLASQSTEQATYFLATLCDSLLSINANRIAARALSTLGGGRRTRATLPQIYGRGALGSAVACLEQTILGQSAKDGLFAKTSVDLLAITSASAVKSAELAKALHIAIGDLLMMFDGVNLVEEGFHLYPEDIRVPAITGADHTYQYGACYAWTDHAGQIHRSSTATPITWTSADPISGSNTVSVQVPGLPLTDKTDVSVELYRTTDAGTSFYLVGSQANDVGWITFLDSKSDDDLIGVQVSAGNISTPTGVTVNNGPAERSAPTGLTGSKVFGWLGAGFYDQLHHYYYVTAVNTFGETDVQASPLMIDVGTHDQGEMYSHHLAWNPVLYITKYRIYRAYTSYHDPDPPPLANYRLEAETTQPWIELRSPVPYNDIAPPTTNTTAGGTLSSGTKYYRVSALNAVGETIPSAEVSASITTGSAWIDWTAVAGASGYCIYGRDTGTGCDKLATVDKDVVSWLDNGSLTPSGEAPTTNTTGVTRHPGAPLLYTRGGVLDNMPPPPVQWLAVGRNRLFIADAENRNRICFSHECLPGYPVEFNPTTNSVIVDPQGGRITCVATLDEKVIIAKESSLYAFAGQGPTTNGLNSDYGQPIGISGDCGTTAPGSFCLMPHGLLFQSAKGIMLLSRALQVSYIGAPVEQFNSDEINSAVLVADQNQVRMADAYRVRVFDYLVSKWSIFTIVGVRSSCIHDGKWTYLTSDALNQEDTSFSDPGDAPISLRWKTAWLNFNGVTGFARVRRTVLLGSYLSEHRVRIRVYMTPSTDSTVPIQDVTATATAGELHHLNLAQQKCSSLQIEVWDDFTDLDPGEGYDITALGFDIALKKGVVKVSASKTYVTGD